MPSPITFEAISAVDNGAQFVNADLHIHSFGGSHDVKDSAMTVEKIIENAVKQSIKVLAITDHNSDANTLKSVEYGQKYTGALLVLPGVEITTANGHLLVYFTPNTPELVRTLLAKINITGKLGDQNSHTSMSMADVIKEAELLGGVCIAAHIDRTKTGFETLAEGYPNWKSDILNATGLFGLEFDDAKNINWYSEDDDVSAPGSERKKLAAARAKIPQLLGRPSLARVQGSDAHTLKAFTGRSGKILTRFKMNDLTFPAFKTALMDPEARVRAVSTIPPSIPRILGMHVIGGFLDSETYHFSDNLNCFIGGRGTGKSSALQTLAYGLGADNKLEGHNNCPGTVIVYSEDANGIKYRYERIQGGLPSVKAKEGKDVESAPADSFRVEYYSQGDLAEVAKDPLNNPKLLQDFLDRHLLLTDLTARESQLFATLVQNSGQLIPLESSAAQRTAKESAIADINKKLLIAEAGRIKEIAADQSKLSNEKNLVSSLSRIQQEYAAGLSLSNFHRDMSKVEATSAPTTGSKESEAALVKIRAAVDSANKSLTAKEAEINGILILASQTIKDALLEMTKAQGGIESQLNEKITALQKQGLSGNIAELQALLKQKTALTAEIDQINSQSVQLQKLRAERKAALVELNAVRLALFERRKAQLASINKNLAQTIQDYTVFVRYEPSGIIDEFRDFMITEMRGSHLQLETIRSFCSKLAPAQLADFVLRRDFSAISTTGGIDLTWATTICQKLCYYHLLHKLEIMAKPPCPIINVKTKSASPKSIPIAQMSDGQKHTIMLTIAMLAESNIPLIIDQPEDDLDNAFIFDSLVKVLRTIKERRQVILVTHNANIAVLGDAELLFPMKRNGNGGCKFDWGSIDKSETRDAVVNILEGGDVAFRRRKEIYGH